EKITDRTRAILPVHLMGKPAEMDSIMNLAGRSHLAVIEDAAEAHGASYRGKKVGSIGHLGAFSLYVAHIVSSIEGGMVTTNDPAMAEILRSLRAHGRACKCAICTINLKDGYCPVRFQQGRDIRFVFERAGFSAKMNEIEAAVGLGNIKYFSKNLSRRRENFSLLHRYLSVFSDYFLFIEEQPYEILGPHAFPIILKPGVNFTRDELVIYFAHQGIDSRDLFCCIPTECAGYRFLGYRPGSFPQAEYVSKNGLHLGIHQDIGEKQVKYLVKILKQFLKGKKVRP
ncbi:MAG: DegT/DnrJ/EryC1/StrS family aminotransferase, partial [Candidatus Omnitrophica bacterium]|nr:DegT/DnrJ/EryC1/StrS family aminotransferase [Candidatus Omnitrophota bacterium]